MNPSLNGDEFLEVDSEENRLKLIEGLKEVLTPIDFTALVQEGILLQSSEYRNAVSQQVREFEVLRPDELPGFVKRQAIAILTSYRGGSVAEILRFVDLPESYLPRIRKILKSLEHPMVSVADALERAGRDFPVLNIWPSATSSATEARFWAPVLVYRALEAIAEVGERYFTSGERASLDELVAAWEFDYYPSKSGPRRFEERSFSRHMTLDGNDAMASLQIFFELDEEERQMQIGYCGARLS